MAHLHSTRHWNFTCTRSARRASATTETEGKHMDKRGSVLTGLGLGAGLMYFLDPAAGRRRRAQTRDRIAHASRLTRRAADTTAHDVAHRASGLAARVRAGLHPEAVDDIVLAERVRSAIGRVVSHPHAIEVDVRNGVVTLRGPILTADAPRLLNAMKKRVRGVRDVVDKLDLHADAHDSSALQGGRTRNVLNHRWSPAARFMTGAVSAMLVSYAAARVIRAGR
jgi:osmotically-inducible protein OsmY